jgi:hypothetical protein
MDRMIQLAMVCVGLAVTGTAWAEQPATALTSFQQNASKRNSEWITLTTNLEQRLARFLPCDPRIRSAIEETSRASEARITALTTYWMAVSGKSKSQLEAIRRVTAQEEGRKGDWSIDRTEAEQERAAVTEQVGFLAISVNRSPGLGDAQGALAAAAKAMVQAETQVQDRQNSGDQFATELHELLTAGEARQNAIETELRIISAEGPRWSAYYSARQARAQTECSITGQDAGADASPASKPATKKGPLKGPVKGPAK